MNHAINLLITLALVCLTDFIATLISLAMGWDPNVALMICCIPAFCYGFYADEIRRAFYRLFKIKE